MPQRHRPELSETVQAERLIGYRRSIRTFGRTRVCGYPSCRTRLSIYNSAVLCAAHVAFSSMSVDPVLHQTVPESEHRAAS
ncbi:MAG TPA: hypothetical protein VK428_01195 [Acidimicrobiales bacterium]|nr:hypothetical protein [Acidimicrobiales bacterium]